MAKIISPEEMILNNGLKIKLLGIKAIPNMHDKALAFLNEKLRGQTVYLKYDKRKFDQNGTLLAYLYLKNETFINLHLIKKGLAAPADDYDYSRRSEFMALVSGKSA